MNRKENISIIVAVDNTKINVASYIAALKKALKSGAARHVCSFEIIFVTNNAEALHLEEIEVFPKSRDVRIAVESAHFTKAMLLSRGVAYASHAIILTLDGSIKLPTKSLQQTISRIREGRDVVAVVPDAFRKQTKNTSPDTFQMLSNAFLLQLQKHPQSEILAFRKEVWETIQSAKYLNKTFAITFLRKALDAGFTVEWTSIAIESKSLYSRLNNIWNTISSSIYLLLVNTQLVKPFATPPSDPYTMLDAGFRYKKKKFVTHSTLAYTRSAINSFTVEQIFFLLVLAEVLILGFMTNPILVAQIIFGFLSGLYLLDVFFNGFLIYKTLRGSSEITFTEEELQKQDEEKLPIYTILCPMYKEAHMLAPFLDGIRGLNWPQDKLDVLILLEEDDVESIETIGKMELPSYVRSVVVPTSQPKTKPKACNYGLGYARGEYVVIYDAEDIPDPQQLKKAYIGFEKAGRNVVCLQAKLNYHNTNQNLLTRFFTAEYSWFFDVALPGLQSLRTIIPLGGTSNHFRKEDLLTLHGWDPFNVTEDADLGMRIFKLGYRTAIIDSVTLEEANSNVWNWIRQRSRWVKGYMQTYLVHTRDIVASFRQLGWQAIMVHLVIGGRILFIFVNPLLWAITFSYFIFRPTVGPIIEHVYTPAILYVGVVSLVLGNYLYILGYVLGCVKREQWGLIKYVFLIPLYLLLISVAGCVSLYQLIFKPYYWEKTVHGLHLIENKKQNRIRIKRLSFALPRITSKSLAVAQKVAHT